MSTSRCDTYVEWKLNGVCIRVVEFDDQSKQQSAASVVYTPELARQIARNLLFEADKVDAVGGATAELKALCAPAKKKVDPWAP